MIFYILQSIFIGLNVVICISNDVFFKKKYTKLNV